MVSLQQFVNLLFGPLKLSRSEEGPTWSVLKKSVLKNFATKNLQRKHLRWRLFLNKVAGIMPTIVLKERLQHMRFPVHFAKCLREPFYRTTPGCCFWICFNQTFKICSVSPFKNQKICSCFWLNIYFSRKNRISGLSLKNHTKNKNFC